MTSDASSSISQRPEPTWQGYDVLLITLGIVLAFGVFIFIYRFIGKEELGTIFEGSPFLLTILVTALEGVVITGCIYFLGLQRRGFTWKDVGLRSMPLVWVIKSFNIGLVAMLLAGMIIVFMQFALGLPIQNPQFEYLSMEHFSWTLAIAMIILGGILAPIAEELYFRGLLYPWLRGRWGVLLANVICSTFFAIVHGNIFVSSSAFLLGIILAWSYEKSDSLWSPIIIHVVNNTVKLVLLYSILALNELYPLLSFGGS